MQKISTASDQYFMSYVNKIQGKGQIAPPPAGIGLKVGLGTCFTLRAKLLGVGGVENTPPHIHIRKISPIEIGLRGF